MNTDDLFRENIDKIARLVQKAFIDIRGGINANTLNKEQKAAVNSLPLDAITGLPENRLKKFPYELF